MHNKRIKQLPSYYRWQFFDIDYILQLRLKLQYTCGVKSVLKVSLFHIFYSDTFIQIDKAANGYKMSETVALASLTALIIPAALQPFAMIIFLRGRGVAKICNSFQNTAFKLISFPISLFHNQLELCYITCYETKESKILKLKHFISVH